MKIKGLLLALNKELERVDVKGELYLVGGAVMCVAFGARPSTLDVDAFFAPASKIREAAKKVAVKEGVSPNWLNDGVKGFLSEKGTFETFLEASHLRVFSANAQYLLAMKCLAMRIGEEFHDIDDVRYLLRHLGVESYDEAIEIITAYYPLAQFPQKAIYVLQELLTKS